MLLPLLLLLCVAKQLLVLCCCSSCCRSLNLIPCSASFSSFNHDLFLRDILLGSTVAFTASICLYSFTASSVIPGMRGAKAGVIPPRRRSPPCTVPYIVERCNEPYHEHDLYMQLSDVQMSCFCTITRTTTAIYAHVPVLPLLLYRSVSWYLERDISNVQASEDAYMARLAC